MLPLKYNWFKVNTLSGNKHALKIQFDFRIFKPYLGTNIRHGRSIVRTFPDKLLDMNFLA